MKLTGTVKVKCQACEGRKGQYTADPSRRRIVCSKCSGTGTVTIPISDVKGIDVKAVENGECRECPLKLFEHLTFFCALEPPRCINERWSCIRPAKQEKVIRRVLEALGGE